MTDPSEIAAAAGQCARMAEDLEWARQKLRRLIVAALSEGQRAAVIAKAAGVSRARVYQIRDGL